MKTSLLTVILALFTLTAFGQTPWIVNQATPHTSGSNTYYGDNLYIWSQKENSNSVSFDARIFTVDNDLIAVSNSLALAGSYFLAVSNDFVLSSNQLAALNASTLTLSNNCVASANVLTAATNLLYTAVRTNMVVVLPDSAGNGGTTIHVFAQDNGAAMYLHVTSLGVITATNSP